MARFFMSLPKEFTLNTGAKIPTVAFGTYGAEGEDIYNAVRTALKVGYRHIDAAWWYHNESDVGRAIKDSKIPREELFVTTKMWPTQARDPLGSLETSLKELGLDYVDLFLMHWPLVLKPDPKEEFTWGVGIDEELSIHDVWHEFQKLPKSKAKAIGVSNFTSTKLQKLLDDPKTTTTPAVNQCELHPSLPQRKLQDVCENTGVRLEAYSPLGQGKEVDDPTVKEIAQRLGVDAGQVILSWNVQRGVVVLPRSVNPERIESNFKLVKLTEEDMVELTKLGQRWNRVVLPEVDVDVFENDIDCQKPMDLKVDPLNA